jgi:hypothetical protein
MQTKQSEAEAAVQGPEARDEWLSVGRFALILAALIFIAFPQVVLGLETFVCRDFGLFGYPLAYFQRECFWHGELPFWNPYNNCGVPFFAQWNTMPLYPGALLYLLLPLQWSLSFFCLLHLFIGGMGMYALGYHRTRNWLGASVAGLIFAFNGLSLNSLMWPSQLATYSWMPWVVLSVERGWQQGGSKLFWGGLAGTFQMLCGGPETIFFTWALLAGLWLLEGRVQEGVKWTDAAKHGNLWERRRTALRFGVMILIVIGLSAAQLLPFLDLVWHSQRGGHFLDLRWALPSRGWANFLVPMAFGHAGEAGVWFEHEQFWTSSFYLGIATVPLGLIAIWKCRQRRVWFLACATLGAYILARGDQTPIYSWLKQVLPPLSRMTFPVKFVIVITFAWPLLAGMAVAILRQPGRRTAQAGAPVGRGLESPVLLTSAAVMLLIAAVVAWAWLSPLPLDDFGATVRNGLSRAIFLGLITVVLVLLARSPSLTQQRMLSISLLVLLWLDAWTHVPQQNPTAPPAVYQPGLVRRELAMNPQPDLEETRVMISPWADNLFEQQHSKVKDAKDSYLADRLGYYCNCNLLDGVPKVNGFFALYPYASDQLTQLLYLSTNSNYPHLADFLSVSHITAPGECTIWEPRGTFLAIITTGQKPVFLDDTNTLRRMISSDFDPRKTVFLPIEAQALVSATHETNARVVASHIKPEELEAEIEASAVSMVTISQTYYHCWRAFVDNKPATLLRANFAFQAVEVPAGKHQLRLVYRERGFRIGTVISLLTALAVGSMVGFRSLATRQLRMRQLGSLAA